MLLKNVVELGGMSRPALSVGTGYWKQTVGVQNNQVDDNPITQNLDGKH